MNHAITWKKHHKTILTSAQHVPSLCGQDVAIVLMRTSELVELYGGGKRNHVCLQQAAGVSVRVSPYRFMRPKASCTGVGPPAKEICKQVKKRIGPDITESSHKMRKQMHVRRYFHAHTNICMCKSTCMQLHTFFFGMPFRS